MKIKMMDVAKEQNTNYKVDSKQQLASSHKDRTQIMTCTVEDNDKQMVLNGWKKMACFTEDQLNSFY